MIQSNKRIFNSLRRIHYLNKDYKFLIDLSEAMID